MSTTRIKVMTTNAHSYSTPKHSIRWFSIVKLSLGTTLKIFFKNSVTSTQKLIDKCLTNLSHFASETFINKTTVDNFEVPFQLISVGFNDENFL